MSFVLSPGQVGRELLFCLLLGAACGAVRAWFPTRGRGAFLPDFLLVGAVLLFLQSYAAGWSEAGALRWYMLAGGAAGALGSTVLLGPPLHAVEHVLFLLLSAPARLLCRWVLHPAGQALRERRSRAKSRRNAKRTAKKAKKNLQNQPRVLYNSNESQEPPER